MYTTNFFLGRTLYSKLANDTKEKMRIDCDEVGVKEQERPLTYQGYPLINIHYCHNLKVTI